MEIKQILSAPGIIYKGSVVGFKRRKFWNEITQEVTDGMSNNESCLMKYAISKEGHYIGDTKTAHRLNRKYGILTFEPRGDEAKTCEVGWSERDKKWYGWSHRAIYGFATKKDARRFAKRVS